MPRQSLNGLLILCLLGTTACRLEGRFASSDAGTPDGQPMDPDAATTEDADAARPEADAAVSDAAGPTEDGSVPADADGLVDANAGGPCVPPNLMGCDLRGADFSGLDLSGWNLSNADLRGADFRNSKLTGSNLSEANLSGAKLEGARTVGMIGRAKLLPAGYTQEWLDGETRLILGPGVDLSGLDLTNIPLDYLDLRGANFAETIFTNSGSYRLRAYDLVACPVLYGPEVTCHAQTTNGRFALVGPNLRLDGADLTGVWLVDANMNDARAVNLVACPDQVPTDWRCVAQPGGRFALVGPRADVSGANLNDVDLEGANLVGANLTETSLLGASLDGAILSFTVLTHAALSGASFVGADLTDGTLRDVDWTGTDLTDAVLYHANTTGLLGCPTTLPSGYQCVAQAGGFVLLGPYVAALYTSLDGLVLDGVDLTGALLDGTSFEGASLAGATLTGVSATRLLDCPETLPDGWICAWTGLATHGIGPYRVLIGPGAAPIGNLQGLLAHGVDLTNADFRGAAVTSADLRNTTLTGARFEAGSLAYSHTGPIERCPMQLPPGFQCFALPGGAQKVVLGPNVIARGLDLSGLDLGGLVLNGVDLRGSDLTDVALDGTTLTGSSAVRLTGCPATLPDGGFRCVEQPDLSLFAIVGPGMMLYEANLRGADLSEVSLMGAAVSGAKLFDLEACPQDPPADTGWSCVMQANGKFAMLGSNVDLRGADLSGVDATAAVLPYARVSGASFANAALAGANVSGIGNWQGTDLAGAVISGVNFGQVVQGLAGCPVLPDASWHCTATTSNGFALFGSETYTTGDLVGADLTGVDLETDVHGCPNIRAFDLSACFSTMPAGWACVEQPMAGGYAVFGRGANLRDADLRGVTVAAGSIDPGAYYCRADLRGADLGGAELKSLPSIIAQDLVECPAELPGSAWQCFEQSNGLHAIAGPYTHLEDIDLDGTDLADVDLSQTTITRYRATGLDACPLALPAGIECVMLQSSGKYALIGAGADLRGLDLSGVTLPGGARAHDLLACPAVLPADTACVQEADGHYAVIGQGADLSGADLAGADLGTAPAIFASGTETSDRVSAYDLVACPALRNWDVCVEQPNDAAFLVAGAFMGDLVGADLTGVDLSHIVYGWFAAYDLIACPAALPAGLVCVLQPSNGKYAVLGSDLRGADLTDVVMPPHYVGTLASDETTTCPNGEAGPCTL